MSAGEGGREQPDELIPASSKRGADGQGTGGAEPPSGALHTSAQDRMPPGAQGLGDQEPTPEASNLQVAPAARHPGRAARRRYAQGAILERVGAAGFIKRRPLRFAALLLLVAFGVRLVGAVGDLPYSYDYDEAFNFVELTNFFEHSTLRPGGHNYPSGYKYLTLPVMYVTKHIAGYENADFRATSFRLADSYNATPMAWYLPRLVPALLSALAVVFVYLVLRRLKVPWTWSLLAAGVTLAAPLIIQESSVMKADPFSAAFVAATVWAAAEYLKVSRGPLEPLAGRTFAQRLRSVVPAFRGRHSAAPDPGLRAAAYALLLGAAAGAATGSKYNAGPMVFSAGLVALLANGRNIRRGIVDGLIVAVGAAGAYLVLSPYTFLDWELFRSDVRVQQTSYGSGRIGTEGRAWLFNFRTVFENSTIYLIAAALVPVLVGLALRGRLRLSRDRMIVLATSWLGCLLWFIWQSSYEVRIDRNIMPVIYPVIIMGAVVFDVVRTEVVRARPRWHSFMTWFAALLLVGAGIQGWKGAVMTRRLVGDEKAAARAWLSDHLRPGDSYAAEAYGTTLADNRVRLEQRTGYLFELTPADIADSGWSYFVTTSDAYGQIRSDPERYGPLIARYEETEASMELVASYEQLGTTTNIFEVPTPGDSTATASTAAPDPGPSS